MRLRIRIGLALGFVAAIVFMVGEFFLADEALLLDPRSDPEAFAEMVTSSGFAVWAGRGLVGVVLEVIASIALYLYLARSRVESLAFWGTLTSIVGDMAGAAMFGLLAFALPGIGRLVAESGPQALDAATGAEPVMLANLVFSLLGLILHAVAIWQSELLPRWSGVMVLAGFLLVPIPVLPAQLLANLLWGAGALWIAAHAWNRMDHVPES